jgi:hypothetical protein
MQGELKSTDLCSAKWPREKTPGLALLISTNGNIAEVKVYGSANLEHSGDHRLVEHRGTWQGFRSHIARWLDDQVTVIVLCNLDSADSSGIAHGAGRRFYPPLQGKIKADVQPDLADHIRELIGRAAMGKLSPESYAESVQAKDAASWTERLSERLRECGPLQGLDLLEENPRDSWRQRRYRARFEHDQLRITSMLDRAGLIAHLSWETE